MNCLNSSKPSTRLVRNSSIAESLGHDRVRHRVQEGDVGARPDRQVTRRILGQLDPSWVDDDEVRATAGGLSDARADNRVVFGRVGAADQNRPRDSRCRRMSWSSDPDPSIVFNPAALGAWQTRAQQSTLLVPMTARANFCAR